jgi:hypothetical protein
VLFCFLIFYDIFFSLSLSLSLPFNCILSSIQLAFLWRVKLARSSCLSHPYSCCGLDEYIYLRKNLRLSFCKWPPGRFSKLLHTHTHVSGPVYNHRVRLTQKQNSFERLLVDGDDPLGSSHSFLSFFFRKKAISKLCRDIKIVKARNMIGLCLWWERFGCIYFGILLYMFKCCFRFSTICCAFLRTGREYRGLPLSVLFLQQLCSAFSSSSYVVKLNEVSDKSSVPVYSPGAFKRIRVY